MIPKDRRGYGWIFLLGLALYLLGVAIFSGNGASRRLAGLGAVVSWPRWRSSGSGAARSSRSSRAPPASCRLWRRSSATLPPGRHYLWWPWQKVEFIVDTSTEIPYNAPVLACPTQENVPLKSIEFFLKFRIEDPVAFVRNIGASNFDMVLRSAVQDAIRQRSRQVRHRARLRPARQRCGRYAGAISTANSTRYGVRIIGANIPDVQLPDQYQQHLATRERVAKELSAYEREWELTRKQRIDTLLMEIERTKKDARRPVRSRCARRRTRRARTSRRCCRSGRPRRSGCGWEIEARAGRRCTSAENEAKALRHLADSYRDNRAVLQYELARRRLDVGAKLAESAPRPVVVRTSGASGESSALSTMLLAQILPQLSSGNGQVRPTVEPN